MKVFVDCSSMLRRFLYLCSSFVQMGLFLSSLCENVCAWLTARGWGLCVHLSLMFTEGGSWRTSHARGALQHSGLHLHRGPSPCSNSCAVSSYQVTRSHRVPQGTLLCKPTWSPTRWTVLCFMLRSGLGLWGVDHDLKEMPGIWSPVWQMKGKAEDGCSVLKLSLLCSS